MLKPEEPYSGRYMLEVTSAVSLWEIELNILKTNQQVCKNLFIQIIPLPLISHSIHFIAYIINWFLVLLVYFENMLLTWGVRTFWCRQNFLCLVNFVLFGGCITWNTQPLLCTVKHCCSCKACEVLSWGDNIARSGTEIALQFGTVLHIVMKYVKSDGNCWPPWWILISLLIDIVPKVTMLLHTSMLIALWTWEKQNTDLKTVLLLCHPKLICIAILHICVQSVTVCWVPIFSPTLNTLTDLKKVLL